MSDRNRWNAKHLEAEFLGEPAPFLEEVLPHLPPGRALDLACGLGANALYLASHGYRVDALDWSLAGLRKLAAAAAARKAPVRAVACDVTHMPLPHGRYDVVLCFRFLDRSLWASMVAALRPGGALVIETFTLARLQERPEFPRRYCLETNELVRTFSKRLRIACYREPPHGTTASLLALK